MPNAGKSSLFNALTKAGAEAANYPFTTIEPNVAVVPVPDQRLLDTAAVTGATDIRLDQIHVHDIAGLVARRAARARASATSSSPTSARPTRSCTSSAPTRTTTSSTPRATSTRSRDIETIETELIFADLDQAERRLERVVQAAPSRSTRRRSPKRRGSKDVVAALQEGKPVRTVPVPEDAPLALKTLSAAHRQAGAVRRQRQRGRDRGARRRSPSTPSRQGAEAVAISSRMEAELVEMDDDEAAVMREELGDPESPA